jgi:hypothetical protein
MSSFPVRLFTPNLSYRKNRANQTILYFYMFSKKNVATISYVNHFLKQNEAKPCAVIKLQLISCINFNSDLKVTSQGLAAIKLFSAFPRFY